MADPNGPYSATPLGVVTVDGTGSFDPDGDPLEYRWSFDGSVQSGMTVDFTAPLTVGIYPVTLTVDDGLETDTASTSVVVELTEDDLRSMIDDFVGTGGLANSLKQQVRGIVNAPNPNAEAGKVNAFKNHVTAQAGVNLTQEEADILIVLIDQLG
ncbi:MAG: PKD domain-containing protein [Ilumatobacter sp.]|nr:PKD domain-containing protein [Ilumatobacter sp.]